VGGALLAVVVSIFAAFKLVVDYLMLVDTSVFSAPALLKAFKLLGISVGLRVLFVALQFIPLADVISLPLVTGYLERKSREAPQQIRMVQL
jgi:hypothetical protein